ncbi:MAG: hypothetical protein AAF702_18485 [Chloroflexota bacterium]
MTTSSSQRDRQNTHQLEGPIQQDQWHSAPFENQSLVSQVVQADSTQVESGGYEFEALRKLLVGSDQERIDDLTIRLEEFKAILDEMDEHINDKEGLIQIITPIIANSIGTSIRDSRGEMISAISPIMADTIRANIRNSQDEMVEALYPILGKMIQRSVWEAMSELRRRIDNQIQQTFSFREFNRRFQARIRGVSPAELALRELLPFDVTDLFLIHRETGILLIYLGDDEINEADLVADLDEQMMQIGEHDAAYDHDLITGMLTAIQDFVADAFGRGEEGHLDEVHYGEKQILIETAQHAYLAVVVEGNEPVAFRPILHDYLMKVENEFMEVLRGFDGNVASLHSAREQLRPLLTEPMALAAAQSIRQSLTPRLPNQISADNLQFEQLREPLSTFQGPIDGLLQKISALPTSFKILVLINLIIFLIWWLIVY